MTQSFSKLFLEVSIISLSSQYTPYTKNTLSVDDSWLALHLPQWKPLHRTPKCHGTGENKASCTVPAGAHWKNDLRYRPQVQQSYMGQLPSWNLSLGTNTPYPNQHTFHDFWSTSSRRSLGRGWAEAWEKPKLSLWLSRLENVKLTHIVYFTLSRTISRLARTIAQIKFCTNQTGN